MTIFFARSAILVYLRAIEQWHSNRSNTQALKSSDAPSTWGEQ